MDTVFSARVQQWLVKEAEWSSQWNSASTVFLPTVTSSLSTCSDFNGHLWVGGWLLFSGAWFHLICSTRIYPTWCDRYRSYHSILIQVLSYWSWLRAEDWQLFPYQKFVLARISCRDTILSITSTFSHRSEDVLTLSITYWGHCELLRYSWDHLA
jgi:hypothetical protein